MSINETKINWEDKFPIVVWEELNLKSKKSNVPTRASEIPNFRAKKSLGGGSQADTNDHSVPIWKQIVNIENGISTLNDSPET